MARILPSSSIRRKRATRRSWYVRRMRRYICSALSGGEDRNPGKEIPASRAARKGASGRLLLPYSPGGPGRDLIGRVRGFLAAPIVADSSAAGWRLVVRHPGGSLAEAVTMTWTRDLMLGLGVLLVLAASMALVLVWTQRVRRLAKMQMDFVAGVSHELRTPVSVISSAAENLADGVVEARPQVKQYGELIRNEAHRLAAMIEQVLLFAATRNEQRQYQQMPVPVGETINSAVADLAHLTSANGFTVEKEVAPGLPPVMADAKVLGRACKIS